ncbi:hypothetical protein [Rubellimicrobium aerolatum]|uniref:Uncharacterized protein n=1 Tax=Rubellimicrobium aerolatum TaxID=490979 RepID=A0ABW0SFS3_9RHOB|nr:hypothetical protein [Rubellimicrobium aerolatum]MBP1806482.1 hypothetical protein [Rubellimicrobium aerolatum]
MEQSLSPSRPARLAVALGLPDLSAAERRGLSRRLARVEEALAVLGRARVDLVPGAEIVIRTGLVLPGGGEPSVAVAPEPEALPQPNPKITPNPQPAPAPDPQPAPVVVLVVRRPELEAASHPDPSPEPEVLPMPVLAPAPAPLPVVVARPAAPAPARAAAVAPVVAAVMAELRATRVADKPVLRERHHAHAGFDRPAPAAPTRVGADRDAVARHLDQLDHRAPWTPALDLQLVEGLLGGRREAVLAELAAAGVRREVALARWERLSAPIKAEVRQVVDGRCRMRLACTVEGQGWLVAELRARAGVA